MSCWLGKRGHQPEQVRPAGNTAEVQVKRYAPKPLKPSTTNNLAAEVAKVRSAFSGMPMVCQKSMLFSVAICMAQDSGMFGVQGSDSGMNEKLLQRYWQSKIPFSSSSNSTFRSLKPEVRNFKLDLKVKAELNLWDP